MKLISGLNKQGRVMKLKRSFLSVQIKAVGIDGEHTDKVMKFKRKKESGTTKFLVIRFLFSLFLIIYVAASLFLSLSGNIAYDLFFLPIVIELLLLGFGSFVLYDVFKRKQEHRALHGVVGLFVAFFGLFPLIVDANLLGFLAFNIDFTASSLVLLAILFFSSLYFLVDAFFITFRK
jgi:hypothetical protein